MRRARHRALRSALRRFRWLSGCAAGGAVGTCPLGKVPGTPVSEFGFVGIDVETGVRKLQPPGTNFSQTYVQSGDLSNYTSEARDPQNLKNKMETLETENRQNKILHDAQMCHVLQVQGGNLSQTQEAFQQLQEAVRPDDSLLASAGLG